MIHKCLIDVAHGDALWTSCTVMFFIKVFTFSAKKVWPVAFSGGQKLFRYTRPVDKNHDIDS